MVAASSTFRVGFSKPSKEQNKKKRRGRNVSLKARESIR